MATGVTLIAARARNGMIGRGNTLVWHIPEELRQFRATTMNHALIVGRKTWQSIGRALPGRRMIVVTRDAQLQAPGCEIVHDVDAAVALARSADDEHPAPPDEVFVAGGAQIYRQALGLATRILITHVDLEPTGDVSFPWPLAPQWQRVAISTHTSSSGIAYSIEDWQRERPGREAQLR